MSQNSSWSNPVECVKPAKILSFHLSCVRSWRSMVRASRTSPSPKLLTSSGTTHTSLSLSKPIYLVSLFSVLVHVGQSASVHINISDDDQFISSVPLYLHPSSLQRAPQQDHAREEERGPSHSQDPGEKRQSLLYPRPSWRHGVPHRPQKHQENEGQHCVRRTKQDQEDAGEDALQYPAAQAIQVRGSM